MPMINEFDGEGHFRTYKMERNPSFSANANALVALLYTPEPSIYIDQISKTASFLCDAWWEGTINDKWVRSSIFFDTSNLLTQIRTYHRNIP
jgi:aphidicolan-16beta-ol synthase/syn-copalyl-diphosphate synthase